MTVGRVRVQLLLRSFRVATRWVCLPSAVGFEDDSEAGARRLSGAAPPCEDGSSQIANTHQLQICLNHEPSPLSDDLRGTMEHIRHPSSRGVTQGSRAPAVGRVGVSLKSETDVRHDVIGRGTSRVCSSQRCDDDIPRTDCRLDILDNG
jgi:hypothetical protein